MPKPQHVAAATAVFEDGWNHARFEGLERAFAASFRFHVHGEGRPMTLDDLRRIVARWHERVPGFRFELHDVVADGDRVAIRATLRGTRPAPAEGTFAVDHMFLFRFEHDRIVEVYEVLDSAEMRTALAPAD